MMTQPHRTFGVSSTAQEVLAGVDLAGRTAIVTGGSSGIGLATTQALVYAGSHVVVPARNPQRAREALAGAHDVDVAEFDLADLESVREFAAGFLDRNGALDILIAGAGVMACPQTRVGPGWDAQFAINHLGHFGLTNLLWPALVASGNARVVATASGYDPSGHIHWDDIHFDSGYDKWEAYGQSKRANVLFAHHLDGLGERYGVRAFSANPGYILTPLQRHLTTEEMVAAGWIDADGVPAPGLFKTPEQGAATQVWAATSPTVDGEGGAYCMDCAIAPDKPVDDAEAARLWALSAELTGTDISS